MRDIIFRAKSVLDSKWVYGYYVNCTYPDAQFCTGHFILEYPNKMHEIYTSTIGQYTGLTDKEGMKIFEGDIVEFQFDNDDDPWPNKRTEKHIGKVIWQEFRADFSIDMGYGMNNDLWRYVRNGNRVKVVANMADSPEIFENSLKRA